MQRNAFKDKDVFWYITQLCIWYSEIKIISIQCNSNRYTSILFLPINVKNAWLIFISITQKIACPKSVRKWNRFQMKKSGYTNIFLHTQYGQKRLPMQNRNSRRNSYSSVLFKIHDIRFPSCNFCNLSSERSNDRKKKRCT